MTPANPLREELFRLRSDVALVPRDLRRGVGVKPDPFLVPSGFVARDAVLSVIDRRIAALTPEEPR